MQQYKRAASIIAILAALSLPAVAQDQQAPADTPPDAGQPVATDAAPEAAEALLSEAQLEDLLAPVALYPDTLLMQLLVATTYPLEVVKADQTMSQAADLAEADRKAAIEAEGYDPSVEVLAVAFPEVLQRMADNISWTETVGDAMLAQSDDVMNAIQVLRQQAIETGALVDSEQQDVSLEETLSTSGEPEQAVVIQPTDPNTVYVPQYDPGVVYDTDRYGIGDALLTGAIAWGTFALIDNIFDDDDDWYDYWGCRNCGGWYGNPIVRNPHVFYDGDRNVDFDRSIDINRNVDRNINRTIDRNFDRTIGWEPDAARRDAARDRLSDRGGIDTGRINLSNEKRGDQLRQQLSDRSGAPDISRQGNSDRLRNAATAAGAAGGAKAGYDALKRSSGARATAVNRPSKAQAPAKSLDKVRSAGGAKAVASKSGGGKAVASKAVAGSVSGAKQIKRSTSGTSKPALKKTASGSKAKAASKRGGASKGKLKR